MIKWDTVHKSTLHPCKHSINIKHYYFPQPSQPLLRGRASPQGLPTFLYRALPSESTEPHTYLWATLTLWTLTSPWPKDTCGPHAMGCVTFQFRTGGWDLGQGLGQNLILHMREGRSKESFKSFLSWAANPVRPSWSQFLMNSTLHLIT